MRKVIVSEILSLEGHFTGPGGDVSVMPFDAGFSESNAALLRGADTVLLGRTTFLGFRDYWPGVRYDPGQPEARARDLEAQLDRGQGRRVRHAHRRRHRAVVRDHPDRPARRGARRRLRAPGGRRRRRRRLRQPRAVERPARARTRRRAWCSWSALVSSEPVASPRSRRRSPRGCGCSMCSALTAPTSSVSGMPSTQAQP